MKKGLNLEKLGKNLKERENQENAMMQNIIENSLKDLRAKLNESLHQKANTMIEDIDAMHEQIKERIRETEELYNRNKKRGLILPMLIGASMLIGLAIGTATLVGYASKQMQTIGEQRAEIRLNKEKLKQMQLLKQIEEIKRDMIVFKAGTKIRVGTTTDRNLPAIKLEGQ